MTMEIDSPVSPVDHHSDTWGRSAPSAPYFEAFENSLIDAILSPSPRLGVEPGSPSNDPLPDVNVGDLPLPLDHPSRIYRSQVPGILLTHPHGPYLGGAGPQPGFPEMRSLLLSFTAKHGVTNVSQFRTLIAKETEAKIADIRARVRSRKEAAEKNARIDKEIEQLTAQREIEVRVVLRKKEEAERKRAQRQEKRMAMEKKLNLPEENVENKSDIINENSTSKRQKILHP